MHFPLPFGMTQDLDLCWFGLNSLREFKLPKNITVMKYINDIKITYPLDSLYLKQCREQKNSKFKVNTTYPRNNADTNIPTPLSIF